MNSHTLPQGSIKVSVDFYDDAEKKKLLDYPSAKILTNIVKACIEVHIEEFLTYYLFHRKRPGKEGYRNYEQLGGKIDRALIELEDWIVFNQSSISVPKDVDPQLISITERVGESIGLCVINRLHNLSEADWDKIPEHPGRSGISTFDYQVASDGQNIIQLETKGSCVSDNSLKDSSISNHKSNIHEKKSKINTKKSYPYPANLRYGTITVLDHRPKSIAKCWLVDPEPYSTETPPEKLRLINRMRFLRDWISFLSPRSQFASALSTRVTDIESVSDPSELDGVPLRKGNGEELTIFPPSTLWGTMGSSFYLNKSRVSDGPAGGVVVQLSRSAFFFLGIRDELPELAGKQDFSSIVNYKSEVGSISKTINCVFSDGRWNKLTLPPEMRDQVKESGPYHQLTLSGKLHYNKDGLVFGVLPIPSNNIIETGRERRRLLFK